MTTEQIADYMAKAREKRKEAVRASATRGACVTCGWRATPGMTASLEYNAHIAEHQLESVLKQIQYTWGAS